MIFHTWAKLPHSQVVGRYRAGLWNRFCWDLTAPRNITTYGARKNAATTAPPIISPAGRTGVHTRPTAFPNLSPGPGPREAGRAARDRSIVAGGGGSAAWWGAAGARSAARPEASAPRETSAPAAAAAVIAAPVARGANTARARRRTNPGPERRPAASSPAFQRTRRRNTLTTMSRKITLSTDIAAASPTSSR